MKNLADLEAAANAATRAFREGLFACFPTGAHVRVLLSAVQKNPSAGTVTGCYGDGRVAVKLMRTNRRGHHTVKHVHWRNVQS